MKPAFAAGAALTLAMLPGCHRPPARASAADGQTPVPAARYIVEAFARYPLVAFSEPRHGAGGTKEFLASLIREPGFAGTVQDVVVECGNARYQDVVDRYMAGEPVARDQLKRAWEETTIASGMWLAPMYEAVLADVRAVNLTRPPSQRVRVLLGDPPIDWSVVRGPADEDMNDWRDAHFAWVVEQQVLKKKHKALIWIGGAHISRGVRFPESLIHLLDRRTPGSAFVVVAVDPTDAEPDVSTRLRRWPSLSAVTVRDTWLGQLEADVGRYGALDRHRSGKHRCPRRLGPRVTRRRRGPPHRRRVADRCGAETASRVGRGDRAVPRRQDSVRVRHASADRRVGRGASDRARRAPARFRADADGEGLYGRSGTGQRSAVAPARASRRGLADLPRHRAGPPACERLRVDARAVVRTNRGGALRQSAGGTRARLAVGSLRPAVLVRFPIAVFPPHAGHALSHAPAFSRSYSADGRGACCQDGSAVPSTEHQISVFLGRKRAA